MKGCIWSFAMPKPLNAEMTTAMATQARNGTIFGIMARESGEIKLNGKPISNKTPRQSIKNGFAMLTEERRATGIFPYASILFNTVISNLFIHIAQPDA